MPTSRVSASRARAFLGGNKATLDPAKVAGKIVSSRARRGGTEQRPCRQEPRGARRRRLRDGPDQLAAGASLNGDFHLARRSPGQQRARAGYRRGRADRRRRRRRRSPRQGSTAPAWLRRSSGLSRGPSAATFDQLKPDLAARASTSSPGYSPSSLLARVPLQPRERDVLRARTSPARGAAEAAASDWTSAMIKSALMTTGENLVSTFAASGTASADANRVRAGAGTVARWRRTWVNANNGSRRLVPVHLRGPASWRRPPHRRPVSDRPERPEHRLDRSATWPGARP